jgi:hypothetical protein
MDRRWYSDKQETSTHNKQQLVREQVISGLYNYIAFFYGFLHI